MIRERLVLFAGLAFIASAFLLLGTVIARSPYTHANLLPTLPPDYDRTPVDTISETDLQVILAELAELPRPPRAAPSDRRLAINTASFLASGVKPDGVEPRAFGKALFTQKCSSCHTVGEGRRVGPDLMGITAQRQRNWLIEFISEPDKVRAQGDPIATQLAKVYGVSMPNLGLSKVQVGAVLSFIEARSGAGSPTQAVPLAAPALFEQKCASCHTIGGGKILGPDLKGISALRPRDWLIEFAAAPDGVIARGDPIAAELVKEYRMPMPNVGITTDQAEELLAYIDLQSGMAPAPAAPVRAIPPSVPAATVEARPSPQAKEEPRPPTPTAEAPRPSPSATKQATPLPPVKEEARPSPTAATEPRPAPPVKQESRPTPTATTESRPAPPVKEEPKPSAPPPAGVSFANDVLPVFQRSCVACHGAMGGWSAASYANVMSSGEHKPIVAPGDPDGSLLVHKLKGTQTVGQRMPPMGNPLPADSIEKIVEWIKTGAKDN